MEADWQRTSQTRGLELPAPGATTREGRKAWRLISSSCPGHGTSTKPLTCWEDDSLRTAQGQELCPWDLSGPCQPVLEQSTDPRQGVQVRQTWVAWGPTTRDWNLKRGAACRTEPWTRGVCANSGQCQNGWMSGKTHTFGVGSAVRRGTNFLLAATCRNVQLKRKTCI